MYINDKNLVKVEPVGPAQGTAFEKYGPGQLMLDWGSFTLKSPLPTTYQDSLDLLKIICILKL